MGLQSCITIVESKKTPPLAFFEALVKKYPTSVSITFVEKDKIVTLDRINEFSAQDLLDTCIDDENINARKVMWLCNTSQTLAPEDAQPYSIVDDDDGTPLMVAFADGDFVSFVKADSAFSAEYHAVTDWLKPHLNLLIEKADSVEEAIAALDTKENKAGIENEFFGDQRGSFVIASADMAQMFQHKNSTALKQEWGWSSDHCGFGQTVVLSAKDKFKRKGTESTPAPASTPSVPAVSVPASTSTQAEDPPGVWVRKGPTVQANHLIKEWYNELFGFDKGAVIPPDILNKILAGIPVFLPKARFDNVRDKSIMKKTTMAEKPNKLDPKHIPYTPTKPQSSGSVIPTPVMSKDTTKKVAEYFTKPGSLGTKLLENMDKEPITAEQAREVFEKHKDWSEQLKDEVKINVDWSFTLPYEAINDLARINPQTVAIMAWERGQRCIIAQARIKELETLLKPQQIKEEGPRAETMAAPVSAKDKFKRKAG
jgi:hypothetical protein